MLCRSVVDVNHVRSRVGWLRGWGDFVRLGVGRFRGHCVGW